MAGATWTSSTCAPSSQTCRYTPRADSNPRWGCVGSTLQEVSNPWGAVPGSHTLAGSTRRRDFNP
eukprot:3495167-Prymnesium_polylepis.1